MFFVHNFYKTQFIYMYKKMERFFFHLIDGTICFCLTFLLPTVVSPPRCLPLKILLLKIREQKTKVFLL